MHVEAQFLSSSSCLHICPQWRALKMASFNSQSKIDETPSQQKGQSLAAWQCGGFLTIHRNSLDPDCSTYWTAGMHFQNIWKAACEIVQKKLIQPKSGTARNLPAIPATPNCSKERFNLSQNMCHFPKNEDFSIPCVQSPASHIYARKWKIIRKSLMSSDFFPLGCKMLSFL